MLHERIADQREQLTFQIIVCAASKLNSLQISTFTSVLDRARCKLSERIFELECLIQ